MEWDERVIMSSQVIVAPDGAVALGLHFDRGAPVAGRIDTRGVADLRAQLDRIEAALRSPNEPAE